MRLQNREVMPTQRDLSGVVEPGQGLGAALMADDAVRQKLEELIGFPVVPGAPNVRLPRPLERDRSWRYLTAAEITPDWEARTGQSGYFLAPVTVAGRYRGLAFQAVEPESADTRPTRSSSSARRTYARSSASATATRSLSG